jgi:hypothetical protein
MGGYGAIQVAMERPEVYAAVYGISRCCLHPLEDAGLEHEAWKHALSLHSPANVKENVFERWTL